MMTPIEELKELVKELDALNQIIGFDIGSLPRRMRSIAKRIIESTGDSIMCPGCDSVGMKVQGTFESCGVTVLAESMTCKECDMNWISGRQDSEIDKRVLLALKEKLDKAGIK